MVTMSEFIFSCMIFIFTQYISSARFEDPHGRFLYEDLKCTTKDGKSYECDVAAKDHCIFEGKKFEIGEVIKDPTLAANCMDNCTCLEGGSINCVENFCDLKRPYIYSECDYEYFIDSCCPLQNCELPKMNCTVNGKIEIQGSLFFPDDMCLECFCKEGFSGKLEEPYCRKRRCFDQLSNMTNLANKCAPLYIFKDCCPATWICNQNQEIVKMSENASNSNQFCDFGIDTVPYGYGFETTVKIDFDTVKARCECNLPPFVTCLDIHEEKEN